MWTQGKIRIKVWNPEGFPEIAWYIELKKPGLFEKWETLKQYRSPRDIRKDLEKLAVKHNAKIVKDFMCDI